MAKKVKKSFREILEEFFGGNNKYAKKKAQRVIDEFFHGFYTGNHPSRESIHRVASDADTTRYLEKYAKQRPKTGKIHGPTQLMKFRNRHHTKSKEKKRQVITELKVFGSRLGKINRAYKEKDCETAKKEKQKAVASINRLMEEIEGKSSAGQKRVNWRYIKAYRKVRDHYDDILRKFDCDRYFTEKEVKQDVELQEQLLKEAELERNKDMEGEEFLTEGNIVLFGLLAASAFGLFMWGIMSGKKR